MISKEVLAKVNEVVAMAVTKHRVNFNIENHEGHTVLRVGQIQKDFSSLYCDGSKNSFDNWIYLERSRSIVELNNILRWLHTLENRHGL